MKLRLKAIAAVMLSISLCGLSSDSFDRSVRPFPNSGHDLKPMADRTMMPPPAIFFSINAVLVDTDRQRGRGPGAIRLAALNASNSVTNALLPALPSETTSNEPFGLFTFRVPDGVLWHKWKGVEADIVGDHAILSRCRADIESCPSHATRFLEVIDAVASKSGRARLDEVNRAVNGASFTSTIPSSTASSIDGARHSLPLQAPGETVRIT